MNKTLYGIFKTFFKVGTLLLGGGYVILPLLQSELVDKKQWIDTNDLCEYYALSQSIPGVIAINTAIFVGYRLRGQLGALVAIFGIVMPAFLAIVLLASMLQEIVNVSFIRSIFYGIGIGVIMLLILAVQEMWGKCVVDKFTCYVFLGAFILSACFKLSPTYIIILAVIIGILYRKKFPAPDTDDDDEIIGDCIR